MTDIINAMTLTMQVQVPSAAKAFGGRDCFTCIDEYQLLMEKQDSDKHRRWGCGLGKGKWQNISTVTARDEKHSRFVFKMLYLRLMHSRSLYDAPHPMCAILRMVILRVICDS